MSTPIRAARVVGQMLLGEGEYPEEPEIVTNLYVAGVVGLMLENAPVATTGLKSAGLVGLMLLSEKEMRIYPPTGELLQQTHN